MPRRTAKLKPWRLLRRQLYEGLCDDTHVRIHASAIVFAPHPDDETLGCGGTIALKSEAGTPVACAFVTDGSTSHRAFMDAEALGNLRMSEAVEAAAVLGLAREDVHFLGFPDGGKWEYHHTELKVRALKLLERYQPQEVYVPYRIDGNRDHEATYGIVRSAVETWSKGAMICEYPIWAWNQWPWVSFNIQLDRDLGRVLLRMLRARLGLRMRTDLRSGVLVEGVLERKRQALAKHRSQMFVLRPGTAWPTLADVADGEFLECFFQDFEVFHCQHVGSVGSRTTVR